MLAETVADTDGQTLGILKYKIASNDAFRDLLNESYLDRPVLLLHCLYHTV